MANLATATSDWRLFRGNGSQTGVADTMSPIAQTHLIVQGIGAQGAAPAGAPLGSLTQTIVADGVADSDVFALQLPAQLKVRWKFQAKDSIESTAAIIGDTVYVGCTDEHLYAIDLKTGQQKWKYKAGPIKAPVSVRCDCVYVGDSHGMFHCVDAATGKKCWTFKTRAEIASGANFAGDNILFGSWDENLYCLSKEGKEVWKFKTNGPVNGSPAVAGDLTFVAGCDRSLHVVDTANGKELSVALPKNYIATQLVVSTDHPLTRLLWCADYSWAKLSTVDLDGQAGASAAVMGDQLYVGTMADQVMAIDWKKSKVLWKFEFEAEKMKQGFYASAAVTEKLVIVGSRDNNVYALDRTTGKEVWSFATEGQVDSSAVIAGKYVYVGSSDGKLYVLELGKGMLVQKIRPGRADLGFAGGGEGMFGNWYRQGKRLLSRIKEIHKRRRP